MKRFLSSSVLFAATLLASGQSGAGFPRITHFFSSEVNRWGVSKIAQNHVMTDGADSYGLFYTIGNGTLQAVRETNPDFTGLLASNMAFVNENDLMLAHPDFRESYLVHTHSLTTTCHYVNRVCLPGYSGTNKVYYYNLADEEAWSFRLMYLIEKFEESENNYPDFYDGLYLDGALSYPMFFYTANGPFDLNCDGQVTAYDMLEETTERWKSRYLDFFTYLQFYLPGISVLCNDMPKPVNDYAGLLNHANGAVSELQLWDYYQRGTAACDWHEEIVNRMIKWNSEGLQPPLSSLIMLYDTTDQGHTVAQAQTDYKRMRFGLATALIAASSFTYANSPKWYDTLCFWNDEYDNAGRMKPGYLGQPAGEPFRFDSTTTTPEIVVNGMFANGLTAWNPWIQPGVCNGNPAGTIEADYGEYYSPPASARLTPNCVAPEVWHLQLVQTNLQGIQTNHRYLLTFMAKASANRSIIVEVGKASTFYQIGLYSTENISTEWSEHRIVFETDNSFIPGSDIIRLVFDAAKHTGTVWIDDVSLTEARPHIWGRLYDNGLAICNTTDGDTLLQLSQPYYHIAGVNETTINNGQLCNAVTLASRDGLVLLNAPTPLPPTLSVSTDTLFMTNSGTINFPITNTGGSPLHWMVDHENLVKDGGLEDDFSHWRHHSEHSGTMGYRGYTAVETNAPASGQKCIALEPGQLPLFTCYTKLFQPNLPLMLNTAYRLQFKTKGWDDEVYVTVGQQCGYDPMFTASVFTSDQWTSHEFVFTNTATSPPTLFIAPGAFDRASVDEVWMMPVSTGAYPAFLTFDTLSGDLPANTTRHIQLRFDTTGWARGTYTGRIMLNTNASNQAVFVPYHFTVTGFAAIPSQPNFSPNPFRIWWRSGHLILESKPETLSPGLLQLYNSCGQLVLSIASPQLNTPLPSNRLSTGVYVALIQTNERAWPTKLIIGN